MLQPNRSQASLADHVLRKFCFEELVYRSWLFNLTLYIHREKRCTNDGQHSPATVMAHHVPLKGSIVFF
jgi:hypothetical protein